MDKNIKMNNLEVYVLAYNNLFCVDYQIKAFKAFCKDNYNLVIIDSNCGEHQQNTFAKKDLCLKHGVEFLELPKELSLKGLNPTNILGRKLNFTYHNLVKPRNPKYFGFIDQDFFPFRTFSLSDTLENFGAYGDVCERDGQKSPSDNIDEVVDSPWVIHPWLSFYKTDFFSDLDPDWDSCHGFDTGGKNWGNVFEKKNLNKKDFWLRHKTMMYYPFDDISHHGPSGYEKHFFEWKGEKVHSQVQIYDGRFIHMLNSKYLDDPMNPKTNWCKGFLDNAILLSGNLEFSEPNGFHNEGPAKSITKPE
jgi:hypothetical protein